MTILPLVSTMNRADKFLLNKINIQSDCLVINQCDKNEKSEFLFRGKKVLWIDTDERGLSRSRNLALQNAWGDVCFFVDDDEYLVDNYEQIILSAFEKMENADIIIFNIKSIGNVRKRYIHKSIKRLCYYNVLRYGSARIAFRREKVRNYNLQMDVRFGAGSEISNGEDSIFLYECLNHKLVIFCYPEYIARIYDDNSTWFKGYTNKFFRDKGAVLTRLNEKYSDLLIFQYILRHHELTNSVGFICALKNMYSGKKIVMTWKK